MKKKSYKEDYTTGSKNLMTISVVCKALGWMTSDPFILKIYKKTLKS